MDKVVAHLIFTILRAVQIDLLHPERGQCPAVIHNLQIGGLRAFDHSMYRQIRADRSLDRPVTIGVDAHFPCHTICIKILDDLRAKHTITAKGQLQGPLTPRSAPRCADPDQRFDR
jgi:hypothetical protein